MGQQVRAATSRRRRFLRRAGVGAVLAFLLGVGICPSPASSEDVDAILKKGNDLRRQGRDREALAEFQRAAGIGESARVTAQIALAEQALGLWVEAESHMVKALAAAGDPWIAKNRATLEGALGTVRRHVGTVEIWGTPEGAEVLFDGKIAGHLPSVGPISVASDEVGLQVRASGYGDVKRTLRVEMGAAIREHVDLRRLPPVAAKMAAPVESVALPAAPEPVTGVRKESAPDRPAPSASSRRPLILTTAGLAGAALIFGVVEHVLWRSKVSSFASMSCDADLPDRGGTTCRQIYDDGGQARTFAFVGYGVAGALAATSVILYVTSPKPEGSFGSPVACAVSPAARIQCGWRF
jgi:hypothetical protein